MIQTPRLLIRPLNREELELYLVPGEALEKSWGIHPFPRLVEAPVQEAIRRKLLPQWDNPDIDHHFITFWSCILEAEQCLVADLCFKGMPDASGKVEIGYGTQPGFEGKGYMTEAVKGLCNWAFRHPLVRAVTAETAIDNIASQKILQKNGFLLQKQTPENYYWIKDKATLIAPQKFSSL